MKLQKTFDSLCTPARVYLGISILVTLVLIVQNLFNGDANELCVGTFKCDFPNVALLLVVKVMYVLFWTWLLSFLCEKGLKSLAWFIVLIPFLLLALGLAVIIYSSLALSNVQTSANAAGNTHPTD
jgi:hypothetical protein